MDFLCFLLSFPLVSYIDSLTPHRLPQYAGSGLSPALLHSYTLAAGTFNTHYLKTVHTCTFNFDLSSDVRLTSNCLLDTTAQMSNLTCRKNLFAHNIFLLGYCFIWVTGKAIHSIFQDKNLGVIFDPLTYYTLSIQKCGPLSNLNPLWHLPHLFYSHNLVLTLSLFG